MKYKLKILTLCAASVIFIAHFAFILNYSYPLNKELNTKYDYYSFWYTHPYFQQDFRLFTPCPDFNFDIYAHYKVGLKEHYSSPLAEVLRQRSLFNGREFLMLSLTSSAAYVARDPSDKNYAIFRTAVWRYLNNKHKDKVYDLHLLFIITDIKTKERITIING